MYSLIEMVVNWYRSSGLSSALITVPALETTVLFIVMTVCLLFRFTRTGLLVSYVFVYRWGWAFRHEIFPNDPDLKLGFSTVYIVFGVLVFTFSVVSMIMRIIRGHHDEG